MHHPDRWIVHTAAPPIGTTQACAACGTVLEDNTAWFEGRVMVEQGDDRGMSWWPTGERIAVLGNCTVVLPDRPLEADERLCAGAN